jgi:CHAT domain-containing protein
LRSIGHESKTGEAAAVEREMAALTEELDRVEAAIHTANPRYAALVKPRTLSTAEIQRQLPGDGTTLLEYSLGRERSYLWAVTKNSLQAYELPPRAEIEQTAQALTASLRMRPAGASRTAAASSEKAAESETLARRLSDMLLRPVAAELRQQRLLIVGDGALNYVPFAALPAPEMGREGEGEKGRRGVGGKRRRGEGERERRKSSILNPQSSILDPPSAIPLILRHEIVTLPSATTLAVLRRETADRAAPAKTVAILADPVFGRHDDRVAQAKTKSDPLAQNSAGERGANPPGKVKVAALEDLERGIKEGVLSGIVLPRLPFSRAEADAIEQTAPAGQAMKALDFAASRDTATSAELGQYRILHIATHGLFNSRHPELSGLFFSLVNERGEARNGLLGIREIYDLQLPADLVVLSACDTALGKEIKGEGVLGLTRGFMYAGARRVVASLWKVNDASTAELMKRFYQGMLGEKKLSPAAALREAQVSMWKEKRWQAPYYWAGFVLQGEW